ncbi:DUF3566 domain-containing protein [bacterium]|nr:DUF3566 domain-containing protein [bacterium]
MKKVELRSLDVLSVMKVVFIIYIVVGIILGILYGLFFGWILGILGLSGGEELPFLPMLGFGVGAYGGLLLGILYGIFYAIWMTIVTAIGALLFNLVASLVGGVHIKVKLSD